MATINKYKNIGKRKKAIVHVTACHGTGVFTVNNKPAEQYFPSKSCIIDALKPLGCYSQPDIKWDIQAKVSGGGFSGQAQAISLALARILVKCDPNMKSMLRKTKLLKRDFRNKERKKYGKYGARRSPQFTKR